MLSKIKKSRAYYNYNRMWPYVRPYWFRALIAMILSIPIGSLDAVIAWCMKPYLDTVILTKTVEQEATSSLLSSPWMILVLIVGITTTQGILRYFNDYLNTWVGTRIVNDIKLVLYNKLLSLETSYFDTRNSGQIIYRFSSDADAASNGLLNHVKTFTSRLVSSISLICVLFINSWKLTIIAIVILTISFYPMSRVRKLIARIIDEQQKSGSKIVTVYNETFSGNRTITAYNYQSVQRQKFQTTLQFLAKLALQMVKRTAWISPLMHIIASIGIAITIGYGAHMISTDQITAGGFVSFLTALLLLYTPLKSLGGNFTSVQVSFLAMERLFEVLDTQPKITDKENAIDLLDITNEIEFQHVSFSYKPDVPVIKDFNLKVKVGECIALVGNSGGGKSTVVSLLPRFYDTTAGQILIDGINIKDISLQSLRNKISVVFQDNFLFSGSIRENILIGKPNATDEEIWKSLEMAYLSDFVSSLKEGLDAQIGERGILLSGGQKQRVAIARAFIKNSDIIILDEATSALDNKAEAIVQKAIENLMKNKTVFVIAHRLSTIQNADKIVVMNAGTISEIGSHEELMKKSSGAYRLLYEAQFKNSSS